MIITLLLLSILVLSFWGAFGGLIKFKYNERKAKKEFEKRQVSFLPMS